MILRTLGLSFVSFSSERSYGRRKFVPFSMKTHLFARGHSATIIQIFEYGNAIKSGLQEFVFFMSVIRRSHSYEKARL